MGFNVAGIRTSEILDYDALHSLIFVEFCPVALNTLSRWICLLSCLNFCSTNRHWIHTCHRVVPLSLYWFYVVFVLNFSSVLCRLQASSGGGEVDLTGVEEAQFNAKKFKCRNLGGFFWLGGDIRPPPIMPV